VKDFGEIQGNALLSQEYECSFTAPILAAYCAGALQHAEAEGRICPLKIEPGVPVHRRRVQGLDQPRLRCRSHVCHRLWRTANRRGLKKAVWGAITAVASWAIAMVGMMEITITVAPHLESLPAAVWPGHRGATGILMLPCHPVFRGRFWGGRRPS